jgi:nucleoside-diphosphate-sugar epimerase
MVGFRTLVLTLQKGYRVRTAVRDDAGFNRIKALPAVAPYTSQLESIIVPNIAVHGAYEEAVKGGVKYIIHIASVMPLPHLSDFENDIVIPTVKATIGILESAQKVDSVKRIVFTSSVSSLLPTHSSNPLVGGSEGIVYNGMWFDPSSLCRGPIISDTELL